MVPVSFRSDEDADRDGEKQKAHAHSERVAKQACEQTGSPRQEDGRSWTTDLAGDEKTGNDTDQHERCGVSTKLGKHGRRRVREGGGLWRCSVSHGRESETSVSM